MTSQKIAISLVAIALFVGSMTAHAADINEGYDAYLRGDDATALRVFRQLADQGNTEAQLNLGTMYDRGRGVPQDYKEAMKWYRKAADQGDVEAQYNLGIMYDNGRGVTQDYAEAAKWFRKAADQGYVEAQYNLGNLYREGQGVPQDYGETVRWHRKAADKGYAEAQTNLGTMYDLGLGVTQDYSEAVRWFRKAAEQGQAVAQDKLGVMYMKGLGVPQDYAQAHMWYNLAAAQGQKLGRKYRDLLAKQMTPAQIAEAQKLAREWKARSGSRIWLLISLSLNPGKERPQDLTGEVSVGSYHSLDNCRQEAIKDNQRWEKLLKAQRLYEITKDLERDTGLVYMAICWNGKEAQLIYPKTIGSPWLAVVTRFKPISYVDKKTGEHHKIGVGIGRVGRFKSRSECRKGLANASTELARILKPKEENAVFCVNTGQGRDKTNN